MAKLGAHINNIAPHHIIFAPPLSYMRAFPAAGGLRGAGRSADGAAGRARRLVGAGVPVHELGREPKSLEGVFMDLTGGAGAL